MKVGDAKKVTWGNYPNGGEGLEAATEAVKRETNVYRINT